MRKKSKSVAAKPKPQAEKMPPPHSIEAGDIIGVFQGEHRSGPLPSADQAERYESLQEGAFQQIIDMAKREQDLREKDIDYSAETMRKNYKLSVKSMRQGTLHSFLLPLIGVGVLFSTNYFIDSESKHIWIFYAVGLGLAVPTIAAQLVKAFHNIFQFLSGNN